MALIQRWGNRPQTPFERFEIKLSDRQVLIRSNTFAGDHYANVILPEGLQLSAPDQANPYVAVVASMVA